MNFNGEMIIKLYNGRVKLLYGAELGPWTRVCACVCVLHARSQWNA